MSKNDRKGVNTTIGKQKEQKKENRTMEKRGKRGAEYLSQEEEYPPLSFNKNSP